MTETRYRQTVKTVRRGSASYHYSGAAPRSLKWRGGADPSYHYKRPRPGAPGDFEDLIAEIGAALLMAAFGMPTYRTLHHARYLAEKRRNIRDPQHDFRAAAAWLLSCP